MTRTGASSGVDAVVITDELDCRPSRAPDFEAESRALASLGEAMSSNPATVLQCLAEKAIELTRCDSAGISLLEPGGEQGTFRWVATAGAWAPYRDGTMPREQSPCGEVIAREAVLLVDHPARAWPALLQANPAIHEGLLAPFHVDGKPAGTVWAIKHGADGRFEAEDARLLRNLARFASAAHQMTLALEGAWARGEEAEARYSSLFGMMNQGYDECEIVRDADGHAVDYRIIDMNPAFERLIGVPVAEARGRTAGQIIPGLESWWTETFDEVVRTGEARRIEREVAPLGRWYEVHAYPRGGDRFSALFNDITERKRIEATLREGEDRQAFLLKVSDALRPLAASADIQGEACRLLAERLDVDRAYYVEVDEEAGTACIERDFVRHGAGSIAGAHRVADFAWSVAILRRGDCHVISDTRTSDLVPAPDRPACAALQIVACMGAPLIKEGRLVGALCVTAARPRAWTESEVGLLREVGERLWSSIERARAEQAMRESEDRFRTVTEAIEDVFYMTDLDRKALLYLSPSFDRIWRRSSTALLADLSGFADTIHPEDRHIVAAAQADQQNGAAVAAEYRIVRPDGAIRWIYDRCFPVGSDGARRSAGVASDITARKQAETALRDSEARFRQFSDASTNILWIRNADTLRMEFASPAFDAIYGKPGPQRGGDDRLRDWAAMILPEDRHAVFDGLRQVRAGGRVELQFRIRRASDGAVRWIHNTDFPLRDAAGEVRWLAGLGSDITDAKEAEERQGVLVAELQHRTRNLIAVVRALSDRTLGNADSLADFGKRFRLRLAALSRVQGLLSHMAAGERVSFDELLRTELAAHGAVDGTAHKVTLDGPAGVPLRSGTVQTFALALHELATNAVKYGALAAPEGHLSVTWHVEPSSGDDLPRLHVEWRETGVNMPDADAPARGGGYGRELIERALPYQLKAKTSYHLDADGVRCTIAVPISRSAGERGAEQAK